MNELFSSASLFAVVLTLCSFEFGLWLQKKTGSPICNPILVAVVVIIVFLKLTGVQYATYQAGSKLFSWFLTPATVCLALPLYEQLQVLKKNGPAIAIGIIGGTVMSLLSILVMCRVFSLDASLTASLLPKSITTAMGIVLSEQMGGIPGITTAVIIITGVLGSVAGTALCKLFRIEGEIAQGVAFGTASHVIGTSRASQLSDLCGAVSSLSLVIAGILTALLCPLINLAV